MKRYLLVVLAIVLILPAVALAQRTGASRDGRDERITRVVRDCEQRTNDFLRAVERAWGHERHANDELDRVASRLEKAMNRVRDSWNRDRNYRRTQGSIGTATDAGREVSRILAHHRLSERVRDEWAAIRSELNNLADVFEQPKIRWDR